MQKLNLLLLLLLLLAWYDQSNVTGMNLFCVEDFYNLLQHYLCKSHLKYKIHKISLTQLNVKTSSRRLKPDSCQTHQHITDRLTPDSCQTQTPPDPTRGVTTASFAFFTPESPPSELVLIFSASQRRRTGAVKRDRHWLLYQEKIITATDQLTINQLINTLTKLILIQKSISYNVERDTGCLQTIRAFLKSSHTTIAIVH
jgi:hypothetical protein